MFLRKNSQSTLPLALVSLILSYSSLETASRVMRVNKNWRSLILNKRFWQAKYKSHFPFYYGELKNPQAVDWYQECLDAFNVTYPELTSPQDRFLLSLIKERDFERLKEKSKEITNYLLVERSYLQRFQEARHYLTLGRKECSFLYWAQLRNDQEMLDYFYKCSEQFDAERQRHPLPKTDTIEWGRGQDGEIVKQRWAVVCRQDVSEILSLPPVKSGTDFFGFPERFFFEAAYHGYLSLLQELYKDPAKKKPPDLKQLIWASFYGGSFSTFKFMMDEFPPEEERAIRLAILGKVVGKVGTMGQVKIIKYLLGRRYPALKKEDNLDDFLDAIKKSTANGELALLEVLFEHRPELFSCGQGDSILPFSPSTVDQEISLLLYMAIQLKQPLVVRYLLECGYDVNAPWQVQKTQSISSLSNEKAEDSYSASSPLLSATARDHDTYDTPLFMAACKKSSRIMQILLGWGASRKIAFDCAMAQKNSQAAITLLQTFASLPPGDSARLSEPSAEYEENKNMARALILGYVEYLQENSPVSSAYRESQLFKAPRVKQAAMELKKMFLEEKKDEESKADPSILASYQAELTKKELGDIYRIARQFFPEKGLPDFEDKPPSQESSTICCSMR